MLVIKTLPFFKYGVLLSTSFNFFNEANYLRVEISGDYNFEKIRVIYGQIIAKCEELKYSKMLIDLRKMNGIVSFLDRFNLANMIQNYLQHFVKIYILIDENPRYKERIFETVANNRGIYIKILHNEDEALKLLQETDNYSAIS